MSLVAYDSSEGSGEESEDDVTPQPDLSSSSNATGGTKNTNSKVSGVLEDAEPVTSNSLKNGLFSMLPAPKRSSAISEVIPEIPVVRNPAKKETVKITIPSLKQFEDDDDEEEKAKVKRKPSKAGSGLIGLLPDPQNLTIKETAKQLVPQSVSRKANIPKPEMKRPSTNNKKPVPVSRTTVNSSPKLQEGNDSDEETTVTDFFSLSSSNEPELPPPDVPSELKPKSTFNSELENREAQSSSTNYALSVPKEPFGTSNTSYPENSNAHYNMTTNTSYDGMYNEVYNPDPNYEGFSSQELDYNVPSQGPETPALKDEAIFRLAGKKRRAQESIEFVDVNGDDLVAGREEWLLKSLSETNSYQPAPKRSDQPSAMHRRKHQITYLAFQAKAREQELKNQWSMNRMTKKQTQSKYGF